MQLELNDSVKDWSLPNDSAEVLWSGLKEKHSLATGISFFWYISREKEFKSMFSRECDLAFLYKCSMSL